MLVDRIRIVRWGVVICALFALTLAAPLKATGAEEGSLPGPLKLFAESFSPAEASAQTLGDSAASTNQERSDAMQLQPTPSADLTFEVHVQDADIKQVLQLLSTQGRKNIVATKEVTGNVTADLYAVTFHEALQAVVKAAGYVYIEEDNFVYVYTPVQLEEMRKAAMRMATRVFRLAYVTAADAEALIEPALSSEGRISSNPGAGAGVFTSDTETGGNSYAINDVLVVTDYEENLERIANLLDELDVRPEQVLIEVTILSATLDEDNELGVNFTTLSGINFDTIGATSSGVGDISLGDITNANLDSFRSLSATAFQTNFPTAASGMTLGVLTDQVALFISALESVTDTTILANPKLLVVNKQRGEIMIGSRDGYLTTTVTEGQVTQSVEFLETGTRLVVRPYICKDGYIRMEIHPEDSDGGVAVTDGLALPTEDTTELTTNLIVRDGHTIVLGGLFREETITSRNQIPVLGNLPYIGAAFRYSKDQTERKEVIILLTPHIITHAADEAVGEQMKDEVERFRIGHRKGVRWWGRSRLAQMHIRWARKDLSEGQREKALWNVDMALGMEPRLEEALRLKERLTEAAYWSDNAQSSVIKYAIQRMIMHELGKPVERIIPPAKPRSGADVDEDVRERLGIEQRYEDPLPPVPDYKLRSDIMNLEAPAGCEPSVDEPVNTPSDEPAESVQAEAVETEAEPQMGAQDVDAAEEGDDEAQLLE